MLPLLQIALAVLVLAWAAKLALDHFQKSSRNGNLKELPGPKGLPIVGYLPFLDSRAWLTFTKLGETYGPIFKVQLFKQSVIVLNDIELAKEALSLNPAFAGRPHTATFETILNSGKSRFAFRTGNAQWRFLRRNAVKALSLFASSKNSRLEAVSDKGASWLEEEISSSKDQLLNPHKRIFKCVAGVIGAVLFGKDFDTDDPVLNGILDVVPVVQRFLALGNLTDTLPIGKFLFQHRVKKFLEFIDPINKMTERHILSIDHNFEGEVRDVADALYVASKEVEDSVLKKVQATRDQVRFISQDLFFAGFGTTMETMRWCMNIMAVYQDKQAKVQAELDAVLDSDEKPNLHNRGQMPYTDAAFLECLRLSSLAPLALPHCVMQDTELRGYFIPKGSLVMTNLYGHHRNPDHFADPFQYKPERFLNEDGLLDRAISETVHPFGVGKRRCVGESLARQEVFILFSRIVRRFRIRSLKPFDIHATGVGFVRTPLETELLFEERR
jgi:cytochrome P450